MDIFTSHLLCNLRIQSRNSPRKCTQPDSNIAANLPFTPAPRQANGTQIGIFQSPTGASIHSFPKTFSMKSIILHCLTICLTVALPTPASAQEPSAPQSLRIICFGAHPDDAEYKSGGTAALWAAHGHKVKMVSVTNGDIGHWNMAGGPLAKRRTAESTEVARKLGIEYQILNSIL